MSSASGLMNRIRRASVGIDPALTDRDVDRLVEGIHQRARGRVVARVGLALGTATVAAAIAVLFVRHAPSVPAPVAVAPWAAPPLADAPAPVRPIRLADGSVVTRLDAGSALAVIEDSPTRVTLELRRGRERFEVAPRPPAQRSFRVRAGEVTVTSPWSGSPTGSASLSSAARCASTGGAARGRCTPARVAGSLR